MFAPTQDAWKEQGRCREVDPEVMFPHDADRQGVAAAKSVCASCPVRVECLDDAVSRGDQWGVWGGLTGRERQQAARRARRRRV